METLTMSAKELRRVAALSRVQDESWSLAEAARHLKISYRQAKRAWARYQQAGSAGLLHRLRGRPSNHGPHCQQREQALDLYRHKYADYGPTLATECLASEDGLSVSVSSLRRWLLAAGLWSPERRRAKHRRRRPRRKRVGELWQMDGSHHDWFEGRRGWAVLMVIIDDASGAIYARFFEAETLEAAQETFGRYVRRQGLPLALYVDQASIYRSDREPTAAELACETQPETQFGRALRELDVELILARSPQAKGRVERVNGTLQDRLVKALRRAGISDLASANTFLEEKFLAEFNVRFGKLAAEPNDAYRPLAESVDLDRILSVRESRTVHHDWTVRWQNRFLQLPPESAGVVQPRQRVEVCQQADGRLRIFRASESGPGSRRAHAAPPLASVRHGSGRHAQVKGTGRRRTTLGAAGGGRSSLRRRQCLSFHHDGGGRKKWAASLRLA